MFTYRIFSVILLSAVIVEIFSILPKIIFIQSPHTHVKGISSVNVREYLYFNVSTLFLLVYPYQ